MKSWWKFLASAVIFLVADAVAIAMALSQNTTVAGALTPFMIGAWVLMMRYG